MKGSTSCHEIKTASSTLPFCITSELAFRVLMFLEKGVKFSVYVYALDLCC